MNPFPDLLAWPNLLIMSFLPLKPYFLYRGQYSRYIKNIEYKTYITISLNSSLKILKKQQENEPKRETVAVAIKSF